MLSDVKLCLMTSNYNALTSNNCCAMASVFDVTIKVGCVTCHMEFGNSGKSFGNRPPPRISSYKPTRVTRGAYSTGANKKKRVSHSEL